MPLSIVHTHENNRLHSVYKLPALSLVSAHTLVAKCLWFVGKVFVLGLPVACTYFIVCPIRREKK